MDGMIPRALPHYMARPADRTTIFSVAPWTAEDQMRWDRPAGAVSQSTL